MKADILADLMAAQAQAPQQSAEIGYHTGVMLAWDQQSGANTVDINGEQFVNLRCLTTGAGLLFAPGDTVVLMRMRTTYFILGRVAAPGAGAAMSTRVGVTANAAGLAAGSLGTWKNLDMGDIPGPSVPNVYVGPARRCLVTVTAEMTCGEFTDSFMGFEVTGATTIPAAYSRSIRLQNWSTGGTIASCSGTFLLDRDFSPSLNSGVHHFTAKYNRFQGASTAEFSSRHLIVIPF
ncbi:hypothetical protein [Amycolatopsis magusensis]|uniref:hypothetical protein n=1 Tax=Amycolatopsis magusensis TaxID=882444 RepID=UPI003C2B7D29